MLILKIKKEFFICVYWAPLHYSTYEGKIDTIKLFTLPETDINCQNEEGMTPLHIAVENGQYNIIYLLLTHPNIDVNRQNKAGIAPLHIATDKCSIDIVFLLLEQKNINVNIKDEKGIFFFYMFIGRHYIMQQVKVELILLNFSHHQKQI